MKRASSPGAGRAIAAAVLAATVLRAAVATAADPVCGDVNRSGTVTTSDALAVLKEAVGQPVDLQCPVPSGMLKTGQTTCYDSLGALIPCDATGQDGESQKGASRSFTDNGDGTVVDNLTGLVWEKLSADGTIHDYLQTYNWADAIAVKIAALNSASFAGHADWRLPDIFELESLRNMGATDPSVYSAFDAGCAPACTVTTCSCTQSGYYWSSSTSLPLPAFAWHVSFLKGTTYPGAKTDLSYVRAVRGG